MYVTSSVPTRSDELQLMRTGGHGILVFAMFVYGNSVADTYTTAVPDGDDLP